VVIPIRVWMPQHDTSRRRPEEPGETGGVLQLSGRYDLRAGVASRCVGIQAVNEQLT